MIFLWWEVFTIVITGICLQHCISCSNHFHSVQSLLVHGKFLSNCDFAGLKIQRGPPGKLSFNELSFLLRADYLMTFKKVIKCQYRMAYENGGTTLRSEGYFHVILSLHAMFR